MKKTTENNETALEVVNKPKELSDYTETELKALYYDCLVIIAQQENNKKLIDNELIKRKS